MYIILKIYEDKETSVKNFIILGLLVFICVINVNAKDYEVMELIPADEQGNIKQKTEDLVGPYELHDFFLYYILRYGFEPEKIYFLAKKA